MKYDIGLDIGVTSVGWAVINLEEKRLEDWGVRLFEVAEHPKDGSSLAAPRREARSVRRRLRRRRHRVDRIHNLMLEKSLLTKKELEDLYPLTSEDLDVWEVRKQGTEQLLTNREFARVLIHCAKHRGYRSNRKSEEGGDEEGRAVLSAVKENHNLMIEKGYRSISHMLIDENKPLRNKGGDYSGVLLRSDIQKELEAIFDKQYELGHPFATEENKEHYITMWGSQRPFASKDGIFSKIGTCSLEKGEKRAPKASYRFQQFRALDKLNRLRVITAEKGIRELTNEERDQVMKLFFSKKEVKYKEIRKALKLNDQERFNELYYDEKETNTKNESKPFVSLEDYYKIHKAIEKELGKKAPDTFTSLDYDTFGYALTVYKDDKDIRDYLKNEFITGKGKPVQNLTQRSYDDDLIEALLKESFSTFSHLSFKALDKILPFMEKGQSYTDACQSAGYNLQARKDLPKQRLLPVIPEDEIRNPVVLRALTQSRKVLNSIIKKYGSPENLYIELAREMGRPHSERKQLEKDYNKNRSINDKAKDKIINDHGKSEVRGHDILKIKLWEEQNERCPYSRKPILADRLLEDGYAQVDHILPYSRSFDDSNTNKVLVLSKENQNKQNKTPYEWFGHNEKPWGEFVSYVDSLNVNKRKKKNLKNQTFDGRNEEEFRERHLNDTRYITRFLKNYIETHLHFTGESKQHVYPVNGAYTSVMRKRWGFNKKNRKENTLHHALDAAIVAVSRRSSDKISAYFKQREVSFKQAMKKMNIYFPQPWEGFVHELNTRLIQDPEQMKEAIIKSDLYEDDPDFRDSLTPIFPSWMPKRSIKGQLHEATFRRNRGKTDEGFTQVVTKTRLEKIPFDKNGDFPMYRKEFDMVTYNAIKDRYLEFGKNKQKAFEKPLYKPSKNMKNAPVIRSVKIEDKRNLFVSVKGEDMIADNASIARTDVYQDSETKKYYLLPVYVSDIKQGNQPRRFIKKNKPYEQWVTKEDHHEYQFSLYPNDLVFIELPKPKNAEMDQIGKVPWKEGYFYFKGVDSATGQIAIRKNDSTFSDRIGVQSLVKLSKYNITPIGDLQLVQKETAHGI